VVADGAPDALDLGAAGIRSVVWATGYRRRYDWLDLPILDRHGEIRQYRGVTDVPGAYVLGLRFQHHRDSNFIDGVGRDARYVAEHIAHPRRTTPRPPRVRHTARTHEK
jgi:putative flavoprotein involved in K+ transport